MLIEYFLLMQIVVFVFFIIAFYARHELMWALVILLSIVTAFNSANIEYAHYEFNVLTTGYDWATTNYYYPFMIWINAAVAVIALLFFIFDIWEQYLLKVGKTTDDGAQRHEQK